MANAAGGIDDAAAARYFGGAIVRNHLGLYNIGHQIENTPGLVKLEVDWEYAWGIAVGMSLFVNITVKMDDASEQQIVAAEAVSPVPLPLVLVHDLMVSI
jgi:hypothetical protein